MKTISPQQQERRMMLVCALCVCLRLGLAVALLKLFRVRNNKCETDIQKIALGLVCLSYSIWAHFFPPRVVIFEWEWDSNDE